MIIVKVTNWSDSKSGISVQVQRLCHLISWISSLDVINWKDFLKLPSNFPSFLHNFQNQTTISIF